MKDDDRICRRADRAPACRPGASALHYAMISKSICAKATNATPLVYGTPRAIMTPTHTKHFACMPIGAERRSSAKCWNTPLAFNGRAFVSWPPPMHARQKCGAYDDATITRAPLRSPRRPKATTKSNMLDDMHYDDGDGRLPYRH